MLLTLKPILGVYSLIMVLIVSGLPFLQYPFLHFNRRTLILTCKLSQNNVDLG